VGKHARQFLNHWRGHLTGKRAAAIQSLLATAKANEIEPYAWLVDTLNKLPTWPNSKINELLPLKNQDGCTRRLLKGYP
jgi:transposase